MLKMNKAVFFLVFACLFASALSQTFVYDVPTSNLVGRVFSAKVRLTSIDAADADTLITVTPVANAALYSVVPASLVFNTTTELNVDKIFNVTVLAAGAQTVDFTYTTTSLVSYTPTSFGLTLTKRPLAVAGFAATSYVGIPSSAIAAAIPSFEAPDTGSVVVTFHADPAVVTFTPASITFNAQTASNALQGFTYYYTVSNYVGTITLYNTFSNDIWFQDVNRTISSLLRPAPTIPSFSSSVKVNQKSNTVVAELTYAPPTTVSYRPTADNTTFTPAVLTFTPTVTSVPFTYTSSYPASSGFYPITFTTEGTDAPIYNNFTSTRRAYANVALTYLSSPNTNTYLMTQTSNSFIFTLSTPAVNGLTVTPHVQETGTSKYVTITPSTLTFAAGESTKSFTLSSSFAASVSAITFTLSGLDAPYYGVPAVDTTNYPYSWDSVTLYTDAGSSDGFCGDSKTFTLRTNFPVVNGFSVAIFPTAGNSDPVVINPASVSFASGDREHTFTVSGKGSPSISFSVTGQDVANLNNDLSTTTIYFDDKQVTISSAYPSTAYPGTSVQYAVTIDQLPATSLVVTPSAAGVTFSPLSVAFSPTSAKTIYVTAVAQSAATFTGTWSTSGADSDCYALSTSSFSLVVSTISPTFNNAGTAQYRKAYPMTITVPHLSDTLIATPYAEDLNGESYAAVFSQATLTFSRAVSTITFTVTFPVYSATNVVVRFTLSGTPASYVSMPIITVPVDTISVKIPVFGSESYYYNTASPSFSVPLSVPTTNGLTVRLYASQITLSTEVLTYAAGASVASFSFSNKVPGSGTDTIYFSLEGADADLYSLTSASTDVYFSTIPIYNNLDNIGSGMILTVNKPFTFVLSTPVAPTNDLVILPQGPFTFSPATISLTAAAPSIQVTATPTSALDDSLSFVLSGSDAAFYDTPSSLSTTIVRGTITVTTPSDTTVSTRGSSQPYLLTSNILPSNGVTVTLYSPIATFTPASIILDAQNPSRSFTFTVNPSAITSSPTVTISYILSGADAANFDEISDTSVGLGTYNQKYSFTGIASSLSLTYGQATTFTVTASGVSTSVTVTPTSQNGNLAFSPASATLSPGSLTATFSVIANGYLATDSSSYIELFIGGVDAALFNQPDSIYVSLQKVSVTTANPASTVVGTSTVGTITLGYQPQQDLTITLSTPQAGVTIQPTVFTLTPASTTTLTYTVTSATAQTATILFRTSGTSAIDYAPITARSVTFNTGTVTTNAGTATWQAPGDRRTIRLTLNAPVASALTITPVASKLTFNPTVITLAAGATYAEVVATADGTTSSASLNYILGGADAARFSAAVVTYSVQQLKIVSTGVDALYADQSFTASLQTASSSVPNFGFSPILVQPVAPGFTFTPASAVFSSQQVAITFIATAANTLPGTTLVYQVNDTVALQASSLSYSLAATSVITPTFSISSSTAVAIGATVQAIFSLFAAGRSTLLTTVPSVTVSFSSNIAGVFNPSTITLANGVTTAPVSFKPSQLYTGTVYIYYSISGAGSSFFTTEGSLSFTNVGKRSLTISAPSQLSTLNSITTYGQETDKFYITAASTSNFQATLTPISDYFDFKPASIYFGNASSTSFSIIPKKLGRALSIQFAISGPDAGLFTIPAALSGYSVIPVVNVTSIPVLVANKKSEAISVSLTPAPLETIIVTPACSGAGTCIFDPPSLTFSPENPTASFTVISRSSNVFNPSQSYVVVPGNTQQTAGGSGGTITFTAADSIGTYNLPLSAYSASTSLAVAPSTFTLSHPRYQMGVESHITISVSELPRSDVAVTFYGTNMEFKPAYVIFTANGPKKQKVKVTPKHSSSYELDYDSSKIEYGCSGSDRANYICPTESQHFVAISRGYVAAAVLLSVFAVVILALAIFFFVIRPRSAGKYKGADSKGKNIELKE